jgi:hypothetical protein
MTRHASISEHRCVGSRALACTAALSAALVVGAAFAQETPSSAPGAPAPAQDAAPNPPPNRPGFIDAFGRFIGDSAAKLNSQLKDANDALGTQLRNANDTLGSGFKNANEALSGVGSETGEAAKGAIGAARDTAGTIIGLPGTHIVNGRERCAEAANGAPDCRAAAEAACRGKGFASGRMLDTQSERKCPVSAFLTGRLPSKEDCPAQTFVIRAICQ